MAARKRGAGAAGSGHCSAGIAAYLILHTGGQRLQTVTAQVNGASVGEFVSAAQKRVLADVKFPRGYYFAFIGEAEAQAHALRDLILYAGVAAVVICLLVFLALRSARGLLLVMCNLPFALVGGALKVFASGGLMPLGSMSALSLYSASPYGTP